VIPRRREILALVCYLMIPVVVIAGAGVHQLVDPEMARGHADYERNHRWLERARAGALLAAAEVAVFVALWVLAYEMIVLKRELMVRLEMRDVGGGRGARGDLSPSSTSPVASSSHALRCPALDVVSLARGP
jgi:hypothetical protein